MTERRAITCFVDDNRHIIQQTLALRRSWIDHAGPDTDMVVMGPAHVLDRLPDDLVKIPQRTATDDPVWRDYRYVNSIACMNGAGSDRLDAYSHLLRTDVDTFILPGWNDFYPETFVWGTGGYSNNDEVRQRIRSISAEDGLAHYDITNVGSTWYGPTKLVRQVSAFSEMLTKHILTTFFSKDEGKWPGWYAGVALLYAGEIAINHCVSNGHRSDQLDRGSTSREPISDFVHIHCWHTDDRFSKHRFMSGQYLDIDISQLDLGLVADYCLMTSLRSLSDLPELGITPA